MGIRKVLVTGSSGTIGTRLCERLQAETDYQVAGVDRRPNAWNPAVQQITTVADLLDLSTFAILPTDVDLVIHLAANARVHDVVLDPDQARDNFLTVYNVLEFCRRNKIPRVLFSSSREVYGNDGGLVHTEEPVLIYHCESPYAASKVAGEALVRSYRQCYGIEFINVRFSNVYGMYDESDRVVPLFIKLLKEQQDLTIYGQDKLLDFTYIDDAVHGVMQALARFDRARNEVYNLAFGAGTTLLEVAETLRSRLGSTSRIQMGEVRPGEVVKYVADITKARERLLYQPQVTFAEGIERAVQWYEANLYP